MLLFLSVQITLTSHEYHLIFIVLRYSSNQFLKSHVKHILSFIVIVDDPFSEMIHKAGWADPSFAFMQKFCKLCNKKKVKFFLLLLPNKLIHVI